MHLICMLIIIKYQIANYTKLFKFKQFIRLCALYMRFININLNKMREKKKDTKL